MLPAVGVGGTLDSAPLGCVSPRHFRPTGGGREQGGERRGNRALLPPPWGPVQMWLDLTVSRLPLLSARTDNKISRWFVVEIKWIKAPMDLNGLKRRAGPHAESGLRVGASISQTLEWAGKTEKVLGMLCLSTELPTQVASEAPHVCLTHGSLQWGKEKGKGLIDVTGFQSLRLQSTKQPSLSNISRERAPDH